MDKILSQEEIDALLKGMSDGQVDTTPEPAKDSDGIRVYDLTNQDRIIRGRMPTLEIMNDNFSRLFRNSLSLSLRRIVDVSCRGVQMQKFGEYIRNLQVPSSLHVFKMEPLRGHAILSLDPKLIFTLVDIFLGGSGKLSFRVEGREFTAIESKLIRKVVNLVYADLEKAWISIQPVTIRHVRSEINPQFASIVAPTDLVIFIPFTVELVQISGGISLCIPYSMIEPIKAKLYSSYQSDQLETDQNWIHRFGEHLQGVKVEISVELGKRSLMLEELLNLKIGDLLPLDQDITAPLIAKVAGVPKFTGRAGVCGEKKAFQVEAKILNS